MADISNTTIGTTEAGGQVIDRMIAGMARIICDRASATGDYPTVIDGLGFFRRDQATRPEPCLIEPSVVVVMQGKKRMHIGGQVYPYDPRSFLVTSLDLPASSQVIDASPEKPCVGLVLRLDLRLIAEMATRGTPATHVRQPPAKGVGLWLSKATPAIVEPFQRLLGLLSEPDAIDLLAPMIKREIHFRLL